VAWLVTIQLVVSLSLLNYFRRSFGISPLLIAVHAPLAAVWTCSAAFGPAIVVEILGLRRGWIARTAMALASTVLLALLLAVYLGSFVSNLWWGNNLDARFVEFFVLRGGILHERPDSLAPAVWLSVAVALGLIFCVYVALSDSLLRSAGAMLGRLRGLWHHKRGVTVLGVRVGIAGLLGVGWLATIRAGNLASRDPVLSLLRTSNAVYDVSLGLGREALRQSEALVRGAYAPVRDFRRRNVIVIIVDSLRPDHMSLFGYERETTPFLSGLYQAGRLTPIERATSTCAESNCGIMSTFASKPLSQLVPENYKLFELLQDQGYATYLLLSGNHGLFNLDHFYGSDRTLLFDGTNSRRYGPNDDRVVLEALEQVPPIQEGEPAFFYVHLMSPQLVGVKLPEYRVYDPSDVKNDWGTLLRGTYDQATVVNNYDNGVTQADALLEQLFEQFERKGYLDDSFVVILADHGEMLGERGSYGHITRLDRQLMNIPMLFYDSDPGPIQSRARTLQTDYATQIDVAPTILDGLGLPIPASWQGRSLFEPLTDRVTHHQTTVRQPWSVAVWRRDDAIYKYVHPSLGDDQLFELRSDPEERRDLIGSADPALLRYLRAELARGIGAR
jgi:hypothetical protein